jgi:hypothetical protein
MSDEPTNKPKLEIVSNEELDAEEEEFRRLRRDLPGIKGAADIGLISVSVGRQPTPKNEFYRTHSDFRPVVALVDIEVGLDKKYVAVAPNMIEPLAGIGITASDHVLYLIISPRSALRIIPARCANADGEQNEWARTKEIALLDGADQRVRMYPDREGNCYKSFPAPIGRFGEPCWPTIKAAKIFKLAFRDKGLLIESTSHPLVQRWAGADRT